MSRKISTTTTFVLFGLIFFGCGGLLSFIFGQVTDLDCTRVETTQFRCQKDTRWMRLVPINQQSITDLTGADVETSCDSDGCTYRVVLLTTDNVAVPLTDFYTSGKEEKQELVAQVNAFVDDQSRHSLSIEGDAGLLGIILPLVFAGVGLLITVIGTVVTLNS